jgi:hypothetical protein
VFEPGDLVECVDAGPILAPGPFRGHPSGLTLGSIYTVTMFYPVGAHPGMTTDALDVREAAHPDPRFTYPAMRFRLLKRRDPEFMAQFLREPVPAEPVDS